MLRLGIAGCGSRARQHGRAAQVLKDRLEIVRCYDRDSIRCLDWRRQFAPNAEAYTTTEDLLDGGDLDGVILASSPAAHVEKLKACIQAGVKKVLCEAPLTLTALQAYEIYRLAQETGAEIVESYSSLYHPRMSRLRSLLQEEGLHNADCVHAAFSVVDDESEDPDSPELSWRHKKGQGGGVPWEYACYTLAAATRLVNDLPISVYAHGERGRYDTIIWMHGIVEYLHGGTTMIQVTKRNSIQDLNITYSNAIVNVPNQCWTPPPDAKLAIELRRGDGTAKETINCEPGDRYVSQLCHFADYIEGRAEPMVSLPQSVVGMYTLDGLVASMLDQSEKELDIPEEVVDAFEETIRR